mgnify:CR=1 FL=1
MGTYKEVEGDLIQLALAGEFDVIAHGCNCFCLQKSGIAKDMSKTFETSNYKLEHKKYKGDINKLGSIDYNIFYLPYTYLYIVNAYTQYNPGKDLDYSALTLCLKKINHIFAGKHIGLPMIGCGIAGGTWGYVQMLIKDNLKDCDVTIVKYKPN